MMETPLPLYNYEHSTPAFFQVRQYTPGGTVIENFYIDEYPSRIDALDAAARAEAKIRQAVAARTRDTAARLVAENKVRPKPAAAPALHWHEPGVRNKTGAVGINCCYNGVGKRAPILLISAQWQETVPGTTLTKMRKATFSTRKYGLKGALERALQARFDATGIPQPSVRKVWNMMKHNLPPVPDGWLDQARERWLQGKLD